MRVSCSHTFDLYRLGMKSDIPPTMTRHDLHKDVRYANRIFGAETRVVNRDGIPRGPESWYWRE